MQPREIAALLDRVGTLDGRIDRQLVDEHLAERAITRWTEALAEVPATLPDGSWDVGRAVRGYYEQRGGDNSARYRPIEPHDILAAWAPHRAGLMQRHTDPAPPVDPDNVAGYLAELRRSRAAVATGRAAPVEQHRELTGGDVRPDLAERLALVGSPIPPAVRQQFVAYRPIRAQREAAVAAGRPDPLAVACTWCGAPVGQPCRSRRMNPAGEARANRRRSPHPSRLDAAAQEVAA